MPLLSAPTPAGSGALVLDAPEHPKRAVVHTMDNPNRFIANPSDCSAAASGPVAGCSLGSDAEWAQHIHQASTRHGPVEAIEADAAGQHGQRDYPGGVRGPLAQGSGMGDGRGDDRCDATRP